MALRRVVTVAAAVVVAAGCTSTPPVVQAPPTETVESVTAPASPSPETTPQPAPTQESAQVDLAAVELADFDVAAGDHPHDVAPAADGNGVWYTAQHAGALGLLDPDTGEVQRVSLGDGSAPHGVIVGPDGDAWVTDGGLNAIVRVDAESLERETFPLPRPDNANLNTAAFDGDGVLWFTGQNGVYGRVAPDAGEVEVFDAPRGTGPYGITATPDGTVWYSSLAGSYIGRIESRDGSVDVVDVPTAGGGARRVWSDSDGDLWVTEWFAGKLARYRPEREAWDEWQLPGDAPQPYAVYVDEHDVVWVTDFGGDQLLAFEPESEEFTRYAWPTAGAAVRQLLGRPGEVWGAGSATDTIVVARTDPS